MRKALFGVGLLLVLVSLGWIFLVSADQKIQPQPKNSNPQAIQRLDNLPLYFVKNKGQAAAAVKFQVKTPQVDVLFSANEIVYQFVRNDEKSGEVETQLPARREELRVGFVGAGQPAEIRGEKMTPAKFNYLRGNDPGKWVEGAPAYEKIIYRELYPGIDLAIAGTGKRIKNEYLVKAGADPAAIQLKYDGADELSVNGSGQLEVRIGTGMMIEDSPACYQVLDGKKVSVEAAYRIGSDSTVGFAVGAYRKDADLVIDPVIYSTFLAGSGYSYSKAIAVDGGGNAYVTGGAYSFSMTAGAFDTTANGDNDAFVMKLNAAGTGVSYATYLGGNASDNGLGIAVDSSGNAYVMGFTRSNDFPVTAGAFDTTYNGGSDYYGGDCFVTKLNAAGSGLVYSTYLGGSGAEPEFYDIFYGYYYSSSSSGHGGLIAVDKTGNAYVTGWTRSSDFPTTAGAFDPSFNDTGKSPAGDGFVTKFNASGTGLVYSTFLGGSGLDNPQGLALDGAGSVYVTGETISADFPVTTGAYDIGLDGRDAFLAKVNPTGTGLVYATFVGGGYNDWGRSVAVDGGGNAYVTGTTASNNFPMTSGAWDTSYNGGNDVFVAKLNDTGSSLLYATYLGGSADDSAVGIGVDGSGNAYVTGITDSPDFPIVPAYLAAVSTGSIFAAKLDASGANLSYSARLGSNISDYVTGLTMDSGGNIYLTGYGYYGFPVTAGAYDSEGGDSFALKMTAEPYLVSLQLSKTTLQFSAIASGGAATRNQTVMITGVGPGSLNWSAVADQTWIKVTPASGAGNGVIQVGVDSTGLTGGSAGWGNSYSGKIKIADPNAANSPKWIDVQLRVYTPGVTQPPLGYFDTPLNGTTGIAGAVPVTGWAIDDIEVTGVKIFRDPAAGEPSGLVFIGDAVFVEGARPDIEGNYTMNLYPLRSMAGWGYMMLTNMLPNHGNGPYKLYAYAYDKEGSSALIGTKSIFCDNAHAVKPFGTIDTPAQGATVAGSAYINYAWVLTPLPSTIPKDGSTIDVLVDGTVLGHPTYNQYRKDVADAFPGLNNSGGPVGFYYLDATKLTNGVHTIEWVATDDGGNHDGIGSRYFSVFNAGAPAANAVMGHREGQSDEAQIGDMYSLRVPDLADILNLPMMFEPVAVRAGFDLKAEPTALAPDHFGLFHIQMRELELIRISLDLAKADQTGRNNPPTPPFRKGGEINMDVRQGGEESESLYSGYLIVGGELRPLPIGSTLDSRTGAFSWMPGPGFIGSYDLVFVGKGAYGPTRSVKLKVTIRPKF